VLGTSDDVSPEPFKFPTLLLCVLNLIWEPRDHLSNRESLAFEWGMFVQENPPSWIILTHHGTEFHCWVSLRCQHLGSFYQLLWFFLKDIVLVGRGGLDIFRWMCMAIWLDIIEYTDFVCTMLSSWRVTARSMVWPSMWIGSDTYWIRFVKSKKSITHIWLPPRFLIIGTLGISLRYFTPLQLTA